MRSEDSHSLLVRAGFVRQVCRNHLSKRSYKLTALQAHSGLFQFLPLGLRVQEKVEKLLDEYMLKLGSSDCSSL